MHKQANLDMWTSISELVRERAARDAIMVTWTKGHATEEDIASGKTSEVEHLRNKAVDLLATAGINKNEADGVEIKAAKQRKLLALIQQTMLVNIWLNRQELRALDQEEQQALDEEAAAIAEMEGAFYEGSQEHHCMEPELVENSESATCGRRAWRYVKAKVPSYQWEPIDGGVSFALKPDSMPKDLREGQASWYYDLDKGGRNRVRIDFPLHLWGEIGHWWSGLRWADRNPGLLRGVTWLELLIDFELSSGVNCMRPNTAATWGDRAEMLRSIVKLVLKVRGSGVQALEKDYGTSRRITSLAPFGALHLSGLLRRPVFVSGMAAWKASAVNAWQWAEEDKVARIQLHTVSYQGFTRGGAKLEEVQDRLAAAARKQATKIRQPTARSTGTQRRQSSSSFE
jgi:hypothetical protein